MRILFFLFFLLMSCESETLVSEPKVLDSSASKDLCNEAEIHLSECTGIDLMTVGDCDPEIAKEILDMSCKDISLAAEDLKEDGLSLLDRLHCKLGVLHFCEVPICEEEIDIEYCLDTLGNDSCGQCSYYDCLEAQANCGDDGYLLNFVGKYCNRFTQVTYPRLSEFGKVWMSTVRECLIYSMEEDYFVGESCESIEKRGIQDHIDCYVDSGICSLPIRDWLSIVSTISPVEMPIMQALSVGINCIENIFN